MTQKLVPPFTYETAVAKVKAAENVWNSRNPAKIALAYTSDSSPGGVGAATGA